MTNTVHPQPATGTPRGYAVAFLEDVRFGPEIQRYLETIEATLQPFGGEWLVHGSPPEILEGSWSGALVVIGFPSLAAARAWYHSPAYQEILGLRTTNSVSRALVVEGVPAGYHPTDTLAKLLAG
ncbi:DUF1330 domain-containing protein [Rhodococcus sp. X156]|uniref:DUF1330 domain-containing protein n=1 Tax=Rhodococcus sp. X156 TaxID=2499145 RepID=UPI000FD80360|nr:DUF1330 domain-containing protein [Rhodococcus sp. X156]